MFVALKTSNPDSRDQSAADQPGFPWLGYGGAKNIERRRWNTKTDSDWRTRIICSPDSELVDIGDRTDRVGPHRLVPRGVRIAGRWCLKYPIGRTCSQQHGCRRNEGLQRV